MRSTFFAAAVVMAASTSDAAQRQRERPVDRAFEHYQMLGAHGRDRSVCGFAITDGRI